MTQWMPRLAVSVLMMALMAAVGPAGADTAAVASENDSSYPGCHGTPTDAFFTQGSCEFYCRPGDTIFAIGIPMRNADRVTAAAQCGGATTACSEGPPGCLSKSVMQAGQFMVDGQNHRGFCQGQGSGASFAVQIFFACAAADCDVKDCGDAALQEMFAGLLSRMSDGAPRADTSS